MVHSSRTSAKYLMASWHEQRARALLDKSGFSDEDLEWLEITDADPEIGTDNPDLYTGETTPVDTETESKPFDYRNDPVHPRK